MILFSQHSLWKSPAVSFIIFPCLPSCVLNIPSPCWATRMGNNVEKTAVIFLFYRHSAFLSPCQPKRVNTEAIIQGWSRHIWQPARQGPHCAYAGDSDKASVREERLRWWFWHLLDKTCHLMLHVAAILNPCFLLDNHFAAPRVGFYGHYSVFCM